MNKRNGVLVATIAGAMLIAGCGQEESNNSASASNLPAASTAATASSPSSDEKVTLTVWGSQPNQAVVEAPFEKINKAFMAKYPNIKIDYQWSETEDSLNVAAAAGSLPDTFYVQGNKSSKMAELAKNGLIIPLDKYGIDLSRFPKGAVDYATIDGKLYSSPPSFTDYSLVYYNKDIFAKNNLQIPKTWDDFVKACDTLLSNGVTPIATGGGGDFDRYWAVQTFAPIFANNLMEQIDQGKKDIDFTQFTSLFDTYESFAKKGYFGKNYLSMDGSAATLAFTNGKAGMIIDGTWANKTYVDSGLSIGRFAVPDPNGVKWAHEGLSNFTTYAVAASSKHPKESAEYVKFLASAEAAQILEDAIGSIPVVQDVKPKDQTVAEFSAFNKMGKTIYHVLSRTSTEKSKPQDLLISDVLPKVISGKISGAEASDMIKKELNK